MAIPSAESYNTYSAWGYGDAWWMNPQHWNVDSRARAPEIRSQSGMHKFPGWFSTADGYGHGQARTQATSPVTAKKSITPLQQAPAIDTRPTPRLPSPELLKTMRSQFETSGASPQRPAQPREVAATGTSPPESQTGRTFGGAPPSERRPANEVPWMRAAPPRMPPDWEPGARHTPASKDASDAKRMPSTAASQNLSARPDARAQLLAMSSDKQKDLGYSQAQIDNLTNAGSRPSLLEGHVSGANSTAPHSGHTGTFRHNPGDEWVEQPRSSDAPASFVRSQADFLFRHLESQGLSREKAEGAAMQLIGSSHEIPGMGIRGGTLPELERMKGRPAGVTLNEARQLQSTAVEIANRIHQARTGEPPRMAAPVGSPPKARSR